MIKAISGVMLALCIAGTAPAQEATPPCEGAMNPPEAVPLKSFAWSFGATDKTMRIRIASMLRGYLQSNFEAPTVVSISQAPDVLH